MANGHENVIKNKIQSTEEARKRGSNGGKASGEARRRKRDIRERLKAALDLPADPRVATALSHTGVEVNDNLDVIIASIMKGAMKSDPRMIEKVLELTDQSPKEIQRKELAEIEKLKASLEAEKLALENEKQRMWLDAVKGINQPDTPDDGFLEALKGTAGEDWSDEVL